jgi:hypothetical protein
MPVFKRAPVHSPEVWDQCFGLTDNPFSPIADKPFPFSRLTLETRPLCPHVETYEWLWPDYYAHEIVAFNKRVEEFGDFLNSSFSIVQEGLIVLVHGSKGSGKTSFSNLCRFGIRERFPEAKTLDIDAEDIGPAASRTLLEKAASRTLLEKTLISKLSETVGKTDVSALNRPSDAIAILVENISPTLLIGCDFEKNQCFELLKWIARLARPYGVPLIFATAWEPELVEGFNKRSRAEPIESTSLELNEFREMDVVNYIRGRIDVFRNKTTSLSG